MYLNNTQIIPTHILGKSSDGTISCIFLLTTLPSTSSIFPTTGTKILSTICPTRFATPYSSPAYFLHMRRFCNSLKRRLRNRFRAAGAVGYGETPRTRGFILVLADWTRLAVDSTVSRKGWKAAWRIAWGTC